MWANKKTIKQRLKACEGCKYYFKDSWLARFLAFFGLETGTCGTPIIGMRRENVKLCGCVMKFAAELIDHKCPLNKW